MCSCTGRHGKRLESLVRYACGYGWIMDSSSLFIFKYARSLCPCMYVCTLMICTIYLIYWVDFLYIYMYVCMCACVCLYVCMCVCQTLYACRGTNYRHTDIQTYRHTDIHTHTSCTRSQCQGGRLQRLQASLALPPWQRRRPGLRRRRLSAGKMRACARACACLHLFRSGTPPVETNTSRNNARTISHNFRGYPYKLRRILHISARFRKKSNDVCGILRNFAEFCATCMDFHETSAKCCEHFCFDWFGFDWWRPAWFMCIYMCTCARLQAGTPMISATGI